MQTFLPSSNRSARAWWHKTRPVPRWTAPEFPPKKPNVNPNEKKRCAVGYRIPQVSLVVVLLLLIATAAPQPVGEQVSFPKGFRDWFVVNSMIVTKESPIFDQLGGMHIIYVNSKGLPTLKKGGQFPYPDGTIFADDVHQFSLKDGAYVEGDKKAVAVMVKDAKKYPTTGGWGFQVWSGGDVAKPLVPDVAHSVDACFKCHTPQKDHDYTFSTYIP